MADSRDIIQHLLAKTEILLKKQEGISKELQDVREELKKLKAAEVSHIPEQTPTEELVSISTPVEHLDQDPLLSITTSTSFPKQSIPPPLPGHPNSTSPPPFKSNHEKFIGENLINKVGIAITILGVGIGAKYSIDNDLISPLTRILLGYLSGLGLLAIGFKLKKNYLNYSAVLVSGAMAILYFMTYAAYSFYGFFPQLVAFGLMTFFTSLTVAIALHYNRQVIALIGLVGAYAIPFLLSNDSGQPAVLFTYMAIINIGILIISFRKYWKPLYYSSFLLTWLVYYLWYANDYQQENHFTIAFIFLWIFFITFYLTFLAYKLIQKDKFDKDDIFLLLVNSFVFYGLGYALLLNHTGWEYSLGLFTICNALVHLAVSFMIYRHNLEDRNLLLFISGLVLVFITIAIPVQLDGNWVTLLWVGEAAILFWIGRSKNAKVYEEISYPLMALAFFSIVEDWSVAYQVFTPVSSADSLTPLLNIHFLTSCIFIAAFGFILFVQRSQQYSSALQHRTTLMSLASFFIPAILLFSIYNAFRLELESFWNQKIVDLSNSNFESSDTFSSHPLSYEFEHLKTLSIINYSILFFALLSFINLKRWKNLTMGLFSFGLSILTLIIFLLLGLYTLSELHQDQTNYNASPLYPEGWYHAGWRYISFAFVGLLLVVNYKSILAEFMGGRLRKSFDLILHFTLICLASSEMIYWMDFSNAAQPDKLGLSILWGIYALLLIVLGIWKNKKHLRIGAIVLFTVTLVKLFLYDISHLNTISKTIVFVSLGILLLIISFLYNKYKHLIYDDDQEKFDDPTSIV